MKKFLVTILLSLPLVASANMMVMKNKQGGFIALSKDTCPLEHDKTNPLYMALATSENVNVPGCWFFMDMTVHIFWFQEGKQPEKYEYPALEFEFVPSDEKK